VTAERLRPLLSDGSGKLRSASSGWEAVAQSGRVVQSLESWIPLPPRSTLMHLPQRQALGRRRSSGRVEPIANGALAVAAVLPVGHLRLLFPAYGVDGGVAPFTLPLYGYAAVAELDGEVVVAASRSDAFSPWTGRRPSDARLRAAVAQAQHQLARSRVIAPSTSARPSQRPSTARRS
jgi:hypothetical protein